MHFVYINSCILVDKPSVYNSIFIKLLGHLWLEPSYLFLEASLLPRHLLLYTKQNSAPFLNYAQNIS